MTRDNSFTFHDFTRLFAPLVRVDVNWSLLAAADTRLTLTVVESLRQTEGWYFPWYLDALGRACGWDDRGAKPVRIVDWSEASAGMQLHLRSSISELAAALGGSDSPAGLLIPTYALGGDQRLVLDGSHRLAAIVEADLQFVAMEACVHGPVEQEIAPDLIHWS